MKELRRYFSYLGKYKYIYWTILIMTLIASAFLDVAYSYMNKLFFNAMEYGDKELFAQAVIFCVILVVCSCLFPYLRYFSIRLVRKLVFDVKISLFHKLMKMDMKYYEEHHSGDALKTLNWDANSLKDSYFSHVYWVTGKLVSGISAIIAMLLYSPILAAISIGFSLITVYLSIKVNQQIKIMEKKIQGSVARLTERLSDILSGFALLKMYSGSSIVVENFQQENEASTAREKQRVHKSATLEMVSFLLGILGNFGTIIAGAFLVGRGKLDYGTVMAVVSLQMSVSSMMQRLGNSMTTLSASLVKAGRVFDFLELDCEEQSVASCKENNRERDADSEMPPLIIEKLCFSYQEEKSVLQDFDMRVEEGEKILLMGESGCGKSTLLKLLMGFYERTSGKIMLYGRDISEYSLEELRQMITYVPQNNYLFEGSIKENIALGSGGGSSASMEDILDAAKLAYVDEFVQKMPQGYDTLLTAGGANLSGGQRQRIAIARAFMKDSPILLMDEPSSALDAESEKMIHQALKKLMNQKIVLMVTHGENGFTEFDRVVKL